MPRMLEEKVVIVTGAGRGIGRDIALLAARQGASVVVNDLGGSERGEGADATPAEQVVAEIEQANGKAVANYDSVASWDSAKKIVQCALDTFGQVDGVVNNAGILRDVIFHKMTEEDWDAVIGVHLKGSFNVSRAAAETFRTQASGAFVHMTSTSGLIGNFGQANYAAAKLGIVGLSKSIALDMSALRGALQLHRAVRLEPLDRHHPGQRPGAGGARREGEDDDAGQDRAARGLPAVRRREGHHRADLRRAHERDLPDEPEPSAALGASRRGVDAGDRRRARHAGAQVRALRTRPLAGRVQLGADLVGRARARQSALTVAAFAHHPVSRETRRGERGHQRGDQPESPAFGERDPREVGEAEADAHRHRDHLALLHRAAGSPAAAAVGAAASNRTNTWRKAT